MTGGGTRWSLMFIPAQISLCFYDSSPPWIIFIPWLLSHYSSHGLPQLACLQCWVGCFGGPWVLQTIIRQLTSGLWHLILILSCPLYGKVLTSFLFWSSSVQCWQHWGFSLTCDRCNASVVNHCWAVLCVSGGNISAQVPGVLWLKSKTGIRLQHKSQLFGFVWICWVECWYLVVFIPSKC